MCINIHNLLIAENNKGNTYFHDDNNCVSEIDADNELNCPANDIIDENK